MNIILPAIDLAKQVLQLCGLNAAGTVVLNKKINRDAFLGWLKDLAPTVIAMEACASAHHWGRLLQARGHTVRLIPAQHVKAFCRVHKTDKGDALAIAEAAQRPGIHFVPVKTINQQDLQMLGRVRAQLVAQRTERICQIRGLAAEYGVIFSKSRAKVMQELPLALEDAQNLLTPTARRALAEVYEDISALDARLAGVMRQLAALAQQEPAYARLLSIPGFGPVIAPAFIAAVGNGRQFRRGRDVSAWLGLVPKQQGTGGKVSLMHITKNGDKDLRTLLIHGARSVLISAHRHDDAKKHWLLGLKARRGSHRTIVACANKLARIGWAILSGEAEFDVNKAFKPRAPRPAAAA